MIDGMQALVAVAVTWAMGLALVWRWVDNRRLVTARGVALHAALAWLVGLGVMAALHWALLVVTRGDLTGVVVAELLAVGMVGLGAWVRRRRWRPPGRPWHRTMGLATLLLALAGVLGVGMAVRAMDQRAQTRPHGNYDAQSMWNVKARYFYRGGEHWQRVLSERTWGHPDYPQVQPLTIARLWRYMGDESPAAQRWVAVGAVASAAAVLGSGLWYWRGAASAVLGMITLLSSPMFLRQASWQYADWSVACFMLGGVVAMTAAVRAGRQARGAWFLAGFVAALAACVKNEGQLFVLVISAAAAAHLLLRGPWSVAWRQFAAWGAGLALPLLWLAWTKSYAPANDMVRAWTLQQMFELLADPKRHQMIGHMARLMLPTQFDHAVLLAAAGFALLAGLTSASAARRAGLLALGVAVVLLTGFYAVYLVTPHDLRWHLSTSLERVVGQVYPTAVFALFLLARSPLELWRRRRVLHSRAPATAPAPLVTGS